MICRMILQVVGFFFADWLEFANSQEGYDEATKETV